PLVAMHGLHHALEHGIEKLARLFWIAVGEQLHRALEIREEDSDLLAFALEGALGGQDLLGEVLWGVGLGRPESLSGRRSGQASRPRALGAKLRRRRKLPTASGAHSGQRRGAFLAELRARLVLVLTPGTLHYRASWESGRG